MVSKINLKLRQAIYIVANSIFNKEIILLNMACIAIEFNEYRKVFKITLS
jgi:hypothetical protein